MTETEQQIARLTRATAARERCARQVTRFTVQATMAKTPQMRSEWADLRDEARRARDEWDAEIRRLHTALLTPA
jgi:hypothetical protein